MIIAIWGLVSGFLILLGLAGAVLPFLPGPPLALAGLIIYAWATDFATIGVTALSVFAALTLVTILFDVFGPALTARGYKASKYGTIGAIVGGLAGVMVLGPIGAFLGPFLGAFAGELIAPKAQIPSALRSAWGAFVGFLLGAIFKFAITLGMLGYFITALV